MLRQWMLALGFVVFTCVATNVFTESLHAQRPDATAFAERCAQTTTLPTGAALVTVPSINVESLSWLALIEDSDETPTTRTLAEAHRVRVSFDAVVVRWTALSHARLAAVNALQTRARLQPIAIPH